MKTLKCGQKRSSSSLKYVSYKMCLEIINLIYTYKKDLTLNNCWGVPYRWTRPHVTYIN